MRNLLPLSGKQNWSCNQLLEQRSLTSSRTLEPASLMNHKDKILSMLHVFASTDQFPILMLGWWTCYFIVFFLGLGHLWAFCSLALHKEFGPNFVEDSSYILSSHSAAFATCLFPLWVSKHSFNSYFSVVSFQYF